MHSFWQRVNALATYAGTVLAFLCIAVTLTDFFHTSDPAVTLKHVRDEGMKRQKGYDRAFPVFSMEADLRSAFSWNTKQLFVWAQAEFSTPRLAANEVVFWNTIIQRRQNAALRVPELRAAFPFAVTDLEGALRGLPYNVTLTWHVMPRVGAFFTGSRTFSGFRMPDEYFAPQKEGAAPAA